MLLSKAGKALLKSFEEPENWTFDNYTAEHKLTGIVLWVGSGALFFDGYRKYEGMLNILERHYLYRKFIAMKRQIFAEQLNEV